jgi:hypothetical protein
MVYLAIFFIIPILGGVHFYFVAKKKGKNKIL